MNRSSEFKKLFLIVAAFAAAFFLPMEDATFQTALQATLDLVHWYAREHVILCLLPAFFIAGIIAVFISRDAVMKYLGAGASKWISYSMAAVSGGILAVCSCTILPLFTGIHKRGAGLGPAIAFLYSGPAISILSVILTARILGPEMGVARTVCATGFSIIIGMVMAWLFRREEQQQPMAHATKKADAAGSPRSMACIFLLFFSLVAVMIFANWAPPQGQDGKIWRMVYESRWYLVGSAAFALCWALVEYLGMPLWKVLVGVVATILSIGISQQYVSDAVFVPLIPMLVALAALSVALLTDRRRENREWALSAWDFTKKTMPLMALGIVFTGFLLGSVHENTSIPGVIPAEWIQQLVGGNSLLANFITSFAGAFMYFSTLTEIPIVQGMMASGMGKGPALALLLAGPSLSLPNMLVVAGVMGWRKTFAYVFLVITLSTVCGYIYGNVC